MRKPRVLVCSKLPGNTEELLQEQFDLTVNEGEAYTNDELFENARDKDAVVSVLVNRIDEKFFQSCPDVKIVANVAVGYDNIDIAAARSRGVLVCNTPGVLTETTADLAFALLLACARRIPESEQYLRNGMWKRFALDLLLGVDVHHKTLGIIGLGRIGQAMAARARGFSMKVLYSQRNRVAEEIEQGLHAQYASMDELLESSDFVSIHCPLNAETHHLIGAEQFRKMKHGAILINTARGAIVDEQELAAALGNGIIYGAALDVFEKEPQVTPRLLELENVVALPHIGSSTIETRTAMGRMAVEAVMSAFQGHLPVNTVNKECWDSFLQRAAEVGLVHA